MNTAKLPNSPPPPALSDLERQVYEWQMWVTGFGEAGQRRLKGAAVFISRGGGVGGAVALELAAAGVGKIILAHAGNLKPSDLNRQILMSHDWLGRPRVECAAQRLRALNPRLEVVAVAENVSAANVARLVGQADVVADSAGVGHVNGLACGAQLKTQVYVFAAVDKLLVKTSYRIKVGLAQQHAGTGYGQSLGVQRCITGKGLNVAKLGIWV